MAEHKPSDHALSVIKAGLNAVPVVGGSIASLIGDYVPSSTQRAVTRTMELLAAKLTTLETRIDVDGVDREEFAELFKSCYLVAVRTGQEEKLRAVASLLANLLLKEGDHDKVPYTEIDHLVRCVDSLSIGAVIVLAAAATLAAEATSSDPRRQEATISFERLRANLPQWDHSLVMGLVSELNSHHLLRMEGRPAIVTAELGNYPLTLTALGNRFVRHLADGRT